MNVLMMVSWFDKVASAEGGGGFHYEQAVDLSKYCNCAIYYPYDRFIEDKFCSGIEGSVQVYRSKYKLENKLRNRLYMYSAMKKIVKDFEPDIIHAHVATEVGRFAIILGKLFHIPVIITEHSTVEASGVETFPHYHYAKFAYGQSKYNACVSDNLCKKVSAIFPNYSFHTVYNGISEMEPRNNMGKYRKEDAVNIGIVAGFYNRDIKGMQFVLPALSNMKKDGYRVHLHVMGDGEYKQEFVELANELGIDKQCTFYGNCKKDKLFDIVSEMDYVVSASIFESFGCAVAEAAMLGKPIVASRSGGVESIVTLKNGILVDKDSEDAIYRGLVEMYEKYKQYDGVQISKEAREKFGMTAISMKYLEIYKEAIERYNNN